MLILQMAVSGTVIAGCWHQSKYLCLLWYRYCFA